MLFVAAAMNCVPLISRCSLTGRTCVSACMCCVGVVRVQPVIILSAVFCVVCSLFCCVCEMFGAQAGEA